MQNFKHTRVGLMAAASVLSLGLAMGVAQAAQAADAPAASSSDETIVVVRGFRASLQSALTTKKKSNLMIESVAAEDMGKFPDQNISESLQRLPGIQIDRENGQGTKVRIRGLDQNVTTLNNDTFVSGLELFRLGEGTFKNTNSLEGIPSELIGSVDVYKSPDASLIEGGLGGIVNLKTRDPRGFKGDWMLGGDVRMNEGTKGKWQPTVSLAFGHKFSSDFAVMGTLAYEKADIHTDLLQGENRGTWAYLARPVSATHNQVQSSTQNIWSPEYRYATNRNQERERIGYSLDGSWKVADGVVWTADWFHSDLKIFTGENSLKWEFNNEGATYDATGLTVNADGSLEKGSVTGNSSEGDSFAQNAEAKTDNFQTAIAWDNGGNLTGKVRYAYSKSDYTSTSGQVDERYTQYGVRNGTNAGLIPNSTAPATLYFTYTNGDMPTFTPSAAIATAMTTPSSVYFKSHWAFGEATKTTDSALSADFKYHPGFAADVVISFGARYSDNKIDSTFGRYLADYSAKGELPASAQGTTITSTDAGHVGETVFVDWTPYGYFQDGAIGLKKCDTNAFNCGRFGNSVAVVTPYETAATNPERVVSVNINGVQALQQDTKQMKDAVAWIQALYPSTKFSFFADPLNTFKVEDKTTSTYVMADAGSEGFHLNAGVRIVHTELTINASNTPVTPLWWGTDSWNGVLKNPDASQTVRSYTDVLPSASAVFDVNDTDKVRASGARVVSAQNLFDLGQGASYNFTRSSTPGPNLNKFLYTNGSGGNPNLDPFRASQFDIAYEHYFGSQGLMSAAFFYKSVDSFIVNNTYSVTVKDQSVAGATTGTFSSPTNGQGGTVKGLELTYQASFDNGFGVNANYTYSDSKSPYANDYQTGLPIPGVSKHAYNVQGYYEGNGIEARVSYSWRDKAYLGNYGFGSGTDTHNLGIWSQAYGQVDASFAYAITPSLKLTVEGVNLNKEASKAYLQFPDLPLRYATGDQRIMVGFRYNFGG